MKANFCAHCGVPVGPADNFCAGCGKQVIRSCPTCGQKWDGVKKDSSPDLPVVPPPEIIIDPKPQSRGTTKLTSARVQPVYGKEFNANSDCQNCGTKGNKKSCPVCDYGR